jgi:phosphate uptake regulator
MTELRKVQKVGYSTLTVSIPAEYARSLELHEGDNLLVREETDATLRLIPVGRGTRMTKASIKADLVDNEELLSKLIVGCYVLGYDAIELTSKNGFRASVLERASRTMRRLRGVEIVESSQNRLLGQSFMDPTKFPVDSLIKRLQLLVSRSLEYAIQALRSGSSGLLNDVRKIQEELDELYWLIVRQLLVALSNREISGKIGLENPLHASGDRVSAKTVEEIGRIILELTEGIMNLKETGIKVEEVVLRRTEALARKAQECFVVTMEGLLASEIKTIEKASALVDETLALEKDVMLELLDSNEYPYLRSIISYLGQLARYCNIIIEIALNRLLRKTSRVCVIQAL